MIRALTKCIQNSIRQKHVKNISAATTQNAIEIKVLITSTKDIISERQNIKPIMKRYDTIRCRRNQPKPKYPRSIKSTTHRTTHAK